jgi:double-stranded uracil-DNA glycosylase
MPETHPFGVFIPRNVKYLLLGSFAGKPATGYEWFYGNGRNQFWSILEGVYGMKLPTKKKQQELFSTLGMAIADMILSCERKANSNLDRNLTNMVFNTRAIAQVIYRNKINTIYFSSRFAERLFRQQFAGIIARYPEIALVTLPSPSPRYAALSRAQKIIRYRQLLPGIISP